MNHQEARQNLPLYADGELDPQAAAELERHLADSAELREELERWRALRRCANRVLNTPSVPEGLEARIRAQLWRERVAQRRRPLRWFGAVTAIAAAIAVIVVLWPRGGRPVVEPRVVSPVRFVEIYRHCAIDKRHRGIDIALDDPAAAREQLARVANFPVLVPDLRQAGFQLDGACRCFREPGVAAIHVFYRRNEPQPAVVSGFSVDRVVHLKGCRCERCAGPRGGEYVYEVAADRDVVVFKWDGPANSFAVCSRMEAEQLRELASEVRLAVARQQPVALAQAD